VRGRLVQDQDLGVAEEGARERHELALAGREIRTPLGDLGLEPAAAADERAIEADPADRVVEGGGLVRLTERDVLGQRAGEQDHVLRHDRDPPAELGEREVPHVDAIELDRTAIALVEPREHLDHGRLAGARRADDRDRCAARHGHVDAAQHRLRARS